MYVVHMLRKTPHNGPTKGASRRGFGRLRQERSGRWAAAYTGPDAVLYRAPQTFDAKDDATAWLSAERRMVDLGDWVSPTTRKAHRTTRGLTLETYANRWLDDRVLKPRTHEHYRSLLDRQILPALGSLTLAALTPSVVRTWHAGMGNGTPTLRAHAYGLLRTILGSALDEELVRTNPCHVRGASSTRRAKTIRPATLDELAALVEAMPEKYRLMVLLASWCALRFGELAELRRSDIDVKNGVIRVRRGVTRADKQMIVGTPKSTAGVRDVVIPPHLLPAVRAHLREYAPGRDDLLFPAKSGGHLSPSSLQKPYERARATAGRPDLRFHDLRHTGAVLAAATGATLAELMARLGHSTAGAALRYQHAAQDRDRVIAEALSRMVEP
jgi:integrase